MWIGATAPLFIANFYFLLCGRIFWRASESTILSKRGLPRAEFRRSTAPAPAEQPAHSTHDENQYRNPDNRQR
jgi:hypothetical protein